MYSDKNMTYILDPKINKPPENKPQMSGSVDQSEIYDSRLTSYGSDKRAYIEPITGQVRWYYDDVNAQNNYYVTRNKLDFMDFGQGAGPMKNQHRSLDEMKKMAQSSFIENTNNQRQNLEQSFMQEYNTKIGWQRRQAPINQYGGNTGTGGGGI